MGLSQQQIGPFQIIGELGQGGMAKVYKAVQPSVNRIIALKVLPQHLEGNEPAVRRFRLEAEIAASLDHPNIVKLWEASTSQPPYYMALEFLGGGTLADRLAEGSLPVQEALRISIALCLALRQAHSLGIVHRDIKPANIMFNHDGKQVVTDFGIARMPERSGLTTVGMTLGTAEYMSPEQAKGLQVDYRSDLYSAAVVLYEMLCGRTPFAHEDPRVTMHQLIYEPAPSPSSCGVQIPLALERVLQKALSRNPGDRYQSGAEFAKALHGIPITTERRQPSIYLEIRKQPRLLLVGLLLVVAITALALGIPQMRSHESEGGGGTVVVRRSPAKQVAKSTANQESSVSIRLKEAYAYYNKKDFTHALGLYEALWKSEAGGPDCMIGAAKCELKLASGASREGRKSYARTHAKNGLAWCKRLKDAGKPTWGLEIQLSKLVPKVPGPGPSRNPGAQSSGNTHGGSHGGSGGNNTQGTSSPASSLPPADTEPAAPDLHGN